ncbi:hypothetical protein OEA41_005310 [Lepraria neglecta]|uniref:Uncharacterized protein n=1 Tax=Lepraria neglecta TaxID=209136 RepID=A0AAD9Z2P2_9LECA|nr:hypothetical protein OEA41_005310 [Lepraria neglecta]
MKGECVQLDSDKGCWKPSSQIFFSQGKHDSTDKEASYASNHFYLPYRFRDPLFSPSFDTEISICYDKYDLVLESRDAMNNLTTVGTQDRSPTAALQSSGYDYLVLKPTLIMDTNLNRTACSYENLGILTATATKGKPEETRGDLLIGFEPFMTEKQKAAYLENPLEGGPPVFGEASIRIVYDDLAYYRTKFSQNPLPTATASITWETHVADLAAGEQSKLQHSFLYRDGFGGEIQTKGQAEPCKGSAKPRWIASGWTMFNNKGDPVKK